MRSSAARAVGVAVALALVAAACGGDDQPTAGAADATTDETADSTTDSSREETLEPTTEASSEATPDPSSDEGSDETTDDPGTTADPGTGAGSTTEEPAGRESDRFEGIGPTIEPLLEANGLDGAGLVIVDREDGIVHEEYWGEFDADRVSLIASSSKILTAGVLVRLQDEGAVDLDAPIADYVPWAADHPDLTVAQLLSNSSGLVGLGPNPAYPPYLCQFLPAGDLEACGEQILTSPDDDADVVAPDTEYRYGGAQWQVAGAVAEAVTGRSWAELIDETYVEPCEVESLGYNNHWAVTGGFDYPADLDPAAQPPTDNPNMEGGAFIDAPDYATLLVMHLRDGECDGGRVLSPEGAALMRADRVGDEYGDAGGESTGYGLGWWIDRTTGVVSDPGAYGSVPWLDVEDGFGAYLVIEADGDTGRAIARELQPVVEAAMTAG